MKDLHGIKIVESQVLKNQVCIEMEELMVPFFNVKLKLDH